jgi:hypothetical protein
MFSGGDEWGEGKQSEFKSMLIDMGERFKALGRTIEDFLLPPLYKALNAFKDSVWGVGLDENGKPRRGGATGSWDGGYTPPKPSVAGLGYKPDLKSTGSTNGGKDKLADDRERMRERIDAFIAKENEASKAWKNYTDGIELVKDAQKLGVGTATQYAEVMRVASERTKDAFSKPFADIKKQMEKKENPLAQYEQAAERNDELYKERVHVLTLGLEKYAESSKEYIEIEKQKNDLEVVSADTLKITALALQRELAVRGYNIDVINKTTESILMGDEAANDEIETRQLLVKRIHEVSKSVNENIAYNEYLRTSFTDVALAAGLSRGFVSSLTKAIGEFARKGKIAVDTLQAMSLVAGVLGSAIGGSAGSGLSSISAGLQGLGVTTDAKGNPLTSSQLSQQQTMSYAAIGNGIGQIVGGQVGKSISATAQGASMGMMAGGPIGAAIGGVIGLVSSFFGSSEEKSARADARKSGYNDILSSALSGGEYSAMLARGGGYTYDNMANYQTTVNGRGGRLFNDRAEAGMEGLVKYVKVMDEALASMAKFSKASIVTELEAIQTKYEYSIATAGNLAELHKAYIADITVALTGFSVDNVSSMLEEAVISSATGEAGKALSEKFEASLATSIRQMAESTFSQNVIMPALQPGLEALAQALKAGADTSGIFTTLKGTLNGLTPIVDEFQKSLKELGVIAIEQTSGFTESLNSFVSATANYKTLLQQQYDLAKSIVDVQLNGYNDIVSNVESLRSSLGSALSSMGAQTITKQSVISAQAEIAVALLKAKTLGVLPSGESLKDSLSVVSGNNKGLYNSQYEYQKDFYTTKYNIAELNDIAGEQLTEAQQQISWLEKISLTLDKSYDNSNTAYEKYLTAAQAQVDGLNGIGLSATVTNETLAEQTKAAQDALQEQISGFAGLLGGINNVDTGVGNVESVMSSIELNQATYDAALKQVAGIYDVNASVVMVNSSIAGLNLSISSMLSERERIAAAEQVAIAKVAADNAANDKAASDAAAQRASESANAFQLSGKNGVTTNLGVGSYNVQDLFGWKGLTGINDLQGKFKIELYIDPNLVGYRANYSAIEGWSNADWSDPRALGGVESFTISRLPGFATGGISTGSVSGYPVTLHGTEAVVPLPNGRSIPVDLNLDALIASNDRLRAEVAAMRAEMRTNNEKIADNTLKTKRALELANEVNGVNG